MAMLLSLSAPQTRQTKTFHAQMTIPATLPKPEAEIPGYGLHDMRGLDSSNLQ